MVPCPARAARAEFSSAAAAAMSSARLPDWSSDSAVIDFKSKDVITAKVKAYDEHLMQLSAYDVGLGSAGRRLINVFVGADDCNVKVHEWGKDAWVRGFGCFTALLSYWKHKNNYHPKAPHA